LSSSLPPFEEPQVTLAEQTKTSLHVSIPIVLSIVVEKRKSTDSAIVAFAFDCWKKKRTRVEVFCRQLGNFDLTPSPPLNTTKVTPGQTRITIIYQLSFPILLLKI